MASILNSYLPVTLRSLKWSTLSRQRRHHSEKPSSKIVSWGTAFNYNWSRSAVVHSHVFGRPLLRMSASSSGAPPTFCCQKVHSSRIQFKYNLSKQPLTGELFPGLRAQSVRKVDRVKRSAKHDLALFKARLREPFLVFSFLRKNRHLNPPPKSGKKKEPKPKLFGPDIFGWGGGLPSEGAGAKKFGMSLETQEAQTFWRDIPGFWRDIPGVPEKFETKVCVQFLAPTKNRHSSTQTGTKKKKEKETTDIKAGT